MSKFLNRGFEIISSATESTVKEYTSNWTALINDARTVRNMIVNTNTTVSDTLSRLKSSNTTKKISDWFYGEESSYESAGDDFDPGFKVLDSSDGQLDGDTKPRELTFDSMTDISDKQNLTMLKIGKHQTEQSVSNTAEIVSALNSRSSEMIASINNINKTLTTINSNFEKIIQLQSVGVSSDGSNRQEIDKGGLFSDGKLSLERIFEASKNAVKNNTIVSTASMLMQMIGGGQGPEAIANMILGFGTNKQLNMLGGRSIDEIGKSVNEAIGTATQSVLNELISSKTFKKVFGDITSFEADKDYGQIVSNDYNKDKVFFDGMTRKSIVQIIPEYLNKINESISGVTHHIDKSGKIVQGKAKNEFNDIADHAISSSGITNFTRRNINTVGSQLLGNKFNESDVDMAGEILTGIIVQKLHNNGTRNISMKELKEHMTEYVTPAVETLCFIKNDPDYWARVCQIILLQTSNGMSNTAKFIQNINQSLHNMMTAAIGFAQSGTINASQAGRITQTMIQRQFVNKYKSQIEDNNDKSTVVDGHIKRIDKSYKKYTDNEYLGGIFGVLNRGINVKVIASGKKKYSPWKIRNNPEQTLESDDDTFGKAIAASLSGAKNDKDLFKDTISTAISETTKAMTGNTDSSNNSGGNGFLSNLFGSMMGGAANGFISNLFKGNMSNLVGENSFLGNIFNKGKATLTNRTTDFMENFKGGNPLKYDRRVQEKGSTIKNSIKENVSKIGSTTHSIVESAVGRIKGSKLYDKASRAKGNLIHKKDDKILKVATEGIENFDIDMIDDDQNKWLSKLAFEAYNKKDYKSAKKFINQMKKGSVKTILSGYINEIERISSKRSKGEAITAKKKLDDIDSDTLSEINKLKLVNVRKFLEKGNYKYARKIAEGMEDSAEKTLIIEQIKILEDNVEQGTVIDSSEDVSIGAVVQDVNTDENKTVFDVIKNGFSKVTSVLGKIAKVVVKIAEKGMRDLTYGLLSMKDGLFGSKEKDENGNIISENKGLIRNLTTEPIKAAVKGIRNTASKIGDMSFSQFAQRRDDNGNIITDENGNPQLMTTREVLQNTTFTSRWERDENGKIKRDENGNKIATDQSSVYDLLKNPIETLKKSLNNLSADLSQGAKNIGKSLKNLTKSLTDTIGKFTSAIKDKISDLYKDSWLEDKVNKFKEKRANREEGTGIGAKIMNSKFMQGATKGFKKAREKANEAKRKQSLAQAREENPLQADINDAIEGSKTSVFSKIHDVMIGIAENIGLIKKDMEEDDNVAETNNILPDTTSSGIDIIPNRPSTDTDVDTDTGGASIGNVLGTSTIETPNVGSTRSGDSGGLLGNIMGNLGEIMGGFTQALLGIGELVFSIVMSMEGVQAIMDLGKSILTDGLQPLNEVAESAIEIITPIADTLKDIVTTIAETVVTIAESVIDAIQPIIEAIQPIIQTVLDLLDPILDVVKVLVGIIMVDYVVPILQAIQPVIELCGALLQTISGVLQIGMGTVIGLLGGLVMGIGGLMAIIGKLPGLGGSIGKSGETFFNQGQQMASTGVSMVTSGMDQFKQGLIGMASVLKNLVLPGDSDDESDEEKEKDGTVDTSKVKLNGTDFGSGDASTVNNSWSYTYGSGNTTMNQHSYGNYMNMSERGCGPIALADAYSRRTGHKVNPVSLVSSMANVGAYEPRRGTSVNSMVSTGSAMGIGMRVGGVTQASLKQASPSNPITLLGSGTGFGTKFGNNHYVNVVGTDRNGGAYITNPMSGRIERQSASVLALNSKLGLYGSGDEFEEYGFNEETTDALDRLRNLTSKLTEMFTGKGTADEVSSKLQSNDEKIKIKEIKNQLGDDYDNIVTKAKEELKSTYPKRDGETDDDYQTRLDKLWDKKGNSLIIKLGGQTAYDKIDERNKSMIEGAEEIKSGYDKMSEGLKNIDYDSFGDNSSSSSGSIVSESGAEMAPFSPIKNIKTYITNKTSRKSPVHDYFAATSGAAFNNDKDSLPYIRTDDGGWYGKSNAPVSTEGVGTTGHDSEAVVINSKLSDTVRAITGGTVTYVTRGGKYGKSDPNGGLGNSVKWRDSAGMYHWYFHLGDVDKNIQEGSVIQPNQKIGTFGNTGVTGLDEKEDLLRYMVTKSGPKGSTGDAGHINPLTYWKFEEGSSNKDSYSKTNLMKNSKWGSIYEQKFSNSDYHNQAVKTGLTAGQEAMIAAIGIHEDSAQKLVGEKSLTKVTADYNGQTAFGIMNWIPDPQHRYVGAEETKYGSTLGEQLPFIKRMYFDKQPTHERARILSSNYSQYASNLQSALGHAPALKPGDAWGPLAETDIAESMGHYVANALIPAGWNTTPVLGQHMATAIDAYNWMVKKGWIKAGGSNGNSDDNSINGRFVSSVSNTNLQTTNGNTDDLIEAASQVWEAYTNKVPAGTYAHTNKGPVKTRSGVTLNHLHPDCSGMLSATMNYMGYTFDPTKSTARTCDKYRWCTYDIVGKTANNGFILGPDGKPSNDWVFKNFNPNDMQEGDIITTQEHVGMYIQPGSDSQNALGFDAGNGARTAIVGPGQAKAYLDGDPNWRSKLQWTMGPSYPGLRTTLRYVGSKDKSTNTESKTEKGGGFTGASDLRVSNSVKKTTGSGDIDIWDTSLSNINNDIPPLDMSKFIDDNNNSNISPTIINQYEIKPDTTRDDEFLEKMNKMTFNVRAQRVEQLLEKLIKIVDDKNNTNTSSTDTGNGSMNLFTDNSIPEPVVRLSRG